MDIAAFILFGSCWQDQVARALSQSASGVIDGNHMHGQAAE